MKSLPIEEQRIFYYGLNANHQKQHGTGAEGYLNPLKPVIAMPYQEATERAELYRKLYNDCFEF